MTRRTSRIARILSRFAHGLRPTAYSLLFPLAHGLRPTAYSLLSLLAHGLRPTAYSLLFPLAHGLRPTGYSLLFLLATAYSLQPTACFPAATVPATVTVTDTVRYADGVAAVGSCRISWQSLVSPDGYAVQAGWKDVRLGAGPAYTSGAISVALTPNIGAVPSGTSYTVDCRLDRGGLREYWIVPGAGPVTIASIRTSAAPGITFLYPQQQQIAEGTGFAVLLDFYRVASATATRAGQCYWDTDTNSLTCSTAAGVWKTLPFSDGNVATATALAADPADCSNQFARGINASGTAQCASVAGTDFGTKVANTILAGPATGADAVPTFRALASADIPNNAADTSGKAGTATALAADPADCTNQFARGVNASGTAQCASAAGTDFGTQVMNRIFAGPAAGDPAAPTFRALASADIPNNAADTSGKAGTATALAADPADCSNQFARGIDASGAAQCASAAGTDFAAQVVNKIFAGPAAGDPAAPTFRALASADIPNNAADTSGKAGTATALAADPADCTNQFTRGINASGTAQCASVAGTDFGTQVMNRIFAGPAAGDPAAPTFRALASADIPNNAADTSGKAGTATALAADPADCGANTFTNAINASGTLSCAAVPYAATTGVQPALGFTPENVANKAAASGYASLDASSTVVQNPANATATPTAAKIPIAGSGGTLAAGWLPISVQQTGAIGISIDGGGSAITTGIKGDIFIPFACAIDTWTVLLDQSGSIVLDLWKIPYASYPPTVANTITASEKPTVSGTLQATGNCAGWITTVSAGDVIRFNVDSASTATRATLVVKCVKNGQTITLQTARTTATGDITLTSASASYQFIDPNGTNRDCTLPGTPATGLAYTVKNFGTAKTITVKDAAAATLVTLTAGDTATIIYDGTAWQVI